MNQRAKTGNVSSACAFVERLIWWASEGHGATRVSLRREPIAVRPTGIWNAGLTSIQTNANNNEKGRRVLVHSATVSTGDNATRYVHSVAVSCHRVNASGIEMLACHFIFCPIRVETVLHPGTGSDGFGGALIV